MLDAGKLFSRLNTKIRHTVTVSFHVRFPIGLSGHGQGSSLAPTTTAQCINLYLVLL